MHPKLAERQWDVLKQRQWTACGSVLALIMAMEETAPQTGTERAHALDTVRDAAANLATIDALTSETLKTSADATLQLVQALKFVMRMERQKAED